MGKMFDCYRPDLVAKNAAKIKADGYTAVGLYIFESSAFKKPLTPTERDTIHAAGLFIVTVYENGFPTTAPYFTTARGNSDAKIAFGKAASIGQPVTAPVYFAVDYDAQPADVVAYFEEINRVAGVIAAKWPIGAYGNGDTLTALKSKGLISYEWLSQSMGWRGSKERLARKPGPNIVQGPGGSVFGIDTDSDTTNGNGGGW